ncbi:zf-HC2 domain-containing protein [Vulcanimicrobium alpinum]|uniref:zf-HC2 domain-containing protein n=1 Tax=Vulcanimicrobium alpinum TaxID=3016050 RepID=UPI00295F0C7C|nr:zf-HC2 domain-containing protein [Vulcanimicrobium alpinum]
MNDRHLGDDAELYALGMTEPEQRGAIEAHLASCDACRARVADAEAAAASLAAALRPLPRHAELVEAQPQATGAPRRLRLGFGLASAAALVFAATSVIEGIGERGASAQLARTDVALTALASSHFAHVTLASAPAVSAKALYARDGAWCFIVAGGVPAGARVVVRRGGRTGELGALSGAAPATLFTRRPGRVDDVAIVDAHGTVLAHGAPSY